MRKFHVNEVLKNEELTLIVVESVDLVSTKSITRFQIYGTAKPVAVVVNGPDGAYAVDAKAKPISIDKLKKEIPELTLERY